MIMIRGAGELATAVAVSLWKCGYDVIVTDLPRPLAIRRTVAFCQVMYDDKIIVEGIQAARCEPEDVRSFLQLGKLPVVADVPDLALRLSARVLVDARMLKSVQIDMREQARLTIGLGPGFIAGENCHLVIETLRGHDLGRIIGSGSAALDTGIPGNIAGETGRRVVRSPSDGVVHWQVNLGDLVAEHDILGDVSSKVRIHAPLTGLVRGLIAPGIRVTKGLKIADVDPRGDIVNFTSISDKARAVGRAVLEAVLSNHLLPEGTHES